VRLIQELLGHSSVRTTEIYTHVSKRQLGRIRSPFDGPPE
jgi:site-specific recombinase XerD